MAAAAAAAGGAGGGAGGAGGGAGGALDVFAAAVPDAANTLGGLHDDKDPEHPSVIAHMVRSLMPGQDLTRVTIPAFFLEPRSLLERMADTLMHPELLLEAAAAATPVERMKGMVRWFMSGFHYKTTGVKKPYNPIIGETFSCFWKHADGSRSQYFAEQVLHRPPVTAVYFENRAHHLTATAHVWTKSQFAAPQTVKSILDGACVLTLADKGEQYWFTFPTYYAHGLLMGTLRMEIGDTVHIVCLKTGLRADIDFEQKPTFGGGDKLNAVVGAIRRMPAGTTVAGRKGTGGGWFGGAGGKPDGEELFHLAGHWDGAIRIAPAGTEPATGDVLLDVSKIAVAPKWVLPVDKQGPWESRRLWAFTTGALMTRPAVDWATVDREKAQLEEEQRLVPCHLKESAPGFEAWKTKKFHLRKLPDPLDGGEKEMYVFDDMKEGAPEANLLALSRALPDERGGLGGAGAVAPRVADMKTITLSAGRVATGWEKF